MGIAAPAPARTCCASRVVEAFRASSPTRRPAVDEYDAWTVSRRARRRALISWVGSGALDGSRDSIPVLRLMRVAAAGPDLHAQRKHPSALGGFDQVAAAAKGKRIVMFMDYDGTLSPIVTDPDMAFMTAEVSLSV
ncbi:hypothetical protein U9M48_029250 [Paspalum notatum var. saurae]|uniref:Trehalose-6-phosphate phosphatase n=1 Tax=Paspalum notatum var. saurae TaxID=547442 RepID=A0AAQ3X2I5_PASNO